MRFNSGFKGLSSLKDISLLSQFWSQNDHQLSSTQNEKLSQLFASYLFWSEISLVENFVSLDSIYAI